jgi:hypothetical protein
LFCDKSVNTGSREIASAYGSERHETRTFNKIDCLETERMLADPGNFYAVFMKKKQTSMQSPPPPLRGGIKQQIRLSWAKATVTMSMATSPCSGCGLLS